MKSLQQRILQLENIFKIILTKRNDRTRIIFIFRMIIIEEYPDESVLEIAKKFNLHSSEVEGYKIALNNYKGKSEQYEKIYNAIQKLDASVNLEKQSRFAPKKFQKIAKPKQEPLSVPEFKGKLPLYEVLDILQKDVKSSLRNKRIKDWNDKDWKQLFTLKNSLA